MSEDELLLPMTGLFSVLEGGGAGMKCQSVSLTVSVSVIFQAGGKGVGVSVGGTQVSSSGGNQSVVVGVVEVDELELAGMTGLTSVPEASGTVENRVTVPPIPEPVPIAIGEEPP